MQKLYAYPVYNDYLSFSHLKKYGSDSGPLNCHELLLYQISLSTRQIISLVQLFSNVSLVAYDEILLYSEEVTTFS